MRSINSFKSKIFQVNNQNFDRHAIDLFHFQYKNNEIYKDYVNQLGINVGDIQTIKDIPFLPIQFFKNHVLKCGVFHHEQIFESSGTTGNTSKHYIQDLSFYNKISTSIFESFFNSISNSIIIGLLPSYLERTNSSLVHMVNHFIENSNDPNSGFYLNDLNALAAKLEALAESEKEIYLFGVTFALLDMAENFSIGNRNIHIIETGGMKGRGKELIRDELHEKLGDSFETDHIYSEYGMTELLSQAYMKNDGFFHCQPWMKVFVRDIYDPFAVVDPGKTGIIKIIDLANIHSCAFIETEDLGVKNENGFKILGRLDNSDMRGCNLLLA